MDKLYRGLVRNFSVPVRFHVYTEASRSIPDYMVRHVLDDYAISGPRKSWWYKMQLFDQTKFSGCLFYFDLDVIICGNLDWMRSLPKSKFCTIKDFTEIFQAKKSQMNSSVMYFDTELFGKIYQQFISQRDYVISRFRGDQDYLNRVISDDQKVFFDSGKIKSWRWQVDRGGIHPLTKHPLNLNQHSIDAMTSIVVFHGDPKPHEILHDEFVKKYWV